ncbi:MAG: aldo/keto reductase [Alphaproteobacteria bacterium]|nr:aldo/keto reductase [Alphaproteobacteria bacterium]
MRVPLIEIAPGYRVSRLIKGGWQTIGRGNEAVDDLLEFVRAGVTTFETADTYEGGEALMGALRGAARRLLPPELVDQIKIHTRYTGPMSGTGPAPKDVADSVDRSLRSLGVERLDLLQMQWWNLDVPGFVDTGMVLVDLHAQGKIDLLGVCNLGVAQLEQLRDAGVPIATNQVLYSAIDRRAERRMAEYCNTHDIALLTFAPLAGGFLSEKWRDAADPVTSGAPYGKEYRALIEAGGGWPSFQRLLDAFASVASRRDRSIASVALRWVLQRGPGQAVLFGASKRDRLPETLAIFDYILDDEDLATIEAAALVASPLDVGEIERAPDSVIMRAIRKHLD